MLVPARNAQEISRPDSLLARIVLVQIRALDPHNPDIICMRVQARVISGFEFRKCPVRALIRIAPEMRHGHTAIAVRQLAESRMARGHKHRFAALLLSLEASDAPRPNESQHYCNRKQ